MSSINNFTLTHL